MMSLAALQSNRSHIECYHSQLTALAINNYDPTHTTTLRNLFSQNMTRRFTRIRGLIRKGIVEEDCFALMRGSGGFSTFKALDYRYDLFTPGRFAFDFPRSGDKVAAFMDWLKKQEQAGILETTRMPQLGTAIEDAWTNLYIKDSYQRGILRARYELKGAGYDVPSIDQTGGIEAAMFQPPHVERLGLLYTRTYNDLKGITDTMDMQISRVLAQAMADGENPRKIARLLTRTISGPVGDLGITDTLGRFIPAQRRAMLLARTEVIRAHHQSMIQEYKNWGLEGVKVKAEWKTAGLGHPTEPCGDCLAKERGGPYTLDEIMNMIPYHPQCRCIALPLDVTEKEEEIKFEVITPLTENERDAIVDYSNINYSGINSKLRADQQLTLEMKQQIDDISNGLSHSKKYEGIVYRGMKFNNLDDYNTFMENITQGNYLVDKGFMSTSKSETVARRFYQDPLGMAKKRVRFEINTINKNAVDFDDLNLNVTKTEKEVLFDKNSKFKIQSRNAIIEKDKYGDNIEVELIKMIEL